LSPHYMCHVSCCEEVTNELRTNNADPVL
jgi:hypothetical protein